MRWLVLMGLLGCGASGPPAPAAPPSTTEGTAEVPEVVVEPPTADPAPAPPVMEEPVVAPDGYVEMEVADVIPAAGGFAVLLSDERRSVVVPIFIGGTEALSIDLRHDGRRYERPLTHDLLDEAVEVLGGKLAKVQVDDLRGGVFIGSIYLRKDGELHEIDARPSDAIALALGNRVPIYVRQTVIDEAGERREDAMPDDGGGST